jgi:signal transduction histidine kinase
MTQFLRMAYGRSTWVGLLYALIGIPLAAAGLAYLVMAVVAGTVLSVVVLGLPWLATGVVGAQQVSAVHRWLARRLLGVRVDDPPRFEPEPGLLGWIRSGLSDSVGWRAAAYLFLRLPLAALAFGVVAVWVYGVMFVTLPAYWRFMLAPVPATGGQPKPHLDILWMSVSTWSLVWAVAGIGVVLLLVAPWLLLAVIAPDRLLIRALLGPGRRAALLTSRARAVDESAATLRRIERDLHDGAQVQLVALAMKLGMAHEEMVDGDQQVALSLVEKARSDARAALAELRDLVRGVHPAALDAGLEVALATLAGRSAMPVGLTVDLPARPSPAIEAIAYFCASELLANACKHSEARCVTLDVRGDRDVLRMRVTDDGQGGAQAEGSGLSGLADRVSMVDGEIVVDSRPGGPTVVNINLPMHA